MVINHKLCSLDIFPEVEGPDDVLVPLTAGDVQAGLALLLDHQGDNDPCHDITWIRIINESITGSVLDPFP